MYRNVEKCIEISQLIHEVKNPWILVKCRPTGRVEIPLDYPVDKLFQQCRMWEEMLSVLIERFSGDTLLASQEVNLVYILFQQFSSVMCYVTSRHVFHIIKSSADSLFHILQFHPIDSLRNRLLGSCLWAWLFSNTIQSYNTQSWISII